MLADRFAADLGAHLLAADTWHPYPTAADRDGWDAFDAEMRQAMIAQGEARLGEPWPALPATLFMEYARTGNRSHYERHSFGRRAALVELVVAECVEHEGRFIDEIINGVWAMCEESFWGVPAHNNHGRSNGPLPNTAERVFDLFAGETGALLAWTLYLLGPDLQAVHPVIPDRMRREIDERILTPYLDRDDFGWMGLKHQGPVNNWNPWCASNALTCALIVEPDPQRRLAIVEKTLRIVDRFLDGYHEDGGCDEGTSYWGRAGASLFDNLDLLDSATDGWLNLWDNPLVGNIGRYMYGCFIADDWFVNFADGGARVRADGYLLCRYGRKIGDPRLVSLGVQAHAMRQASATLRYRESFLRLLPKLFDCPELNEGVTGDLPTPFGQQYWMDGIEVMTAREHEGSSDGFFVAAKGGHNAESHNHNDVGQFIVYLDGRPIIIDLGVETYTKQTFSRDRYDIWTMQSAWHNLPTIGGYQQVPGRDRAAQGVSCQLDDDWAELILDLAAAYPAEAGLRTWLRMVILQRGDTEVVVQDYFELSQPQQVTLSLVLANEPTLGDGSLTTGGATIRWSPELKVSVERVAVDDGRLQPVWGEAVWRVMLASDGAVSEGEWQVVVTA